MGDKIKGRRSKEWAYHMGRTPHLIKADLYFISSNA